MAIMIFLSYVSYKYMYRVERMREKENCICYILLELDRYQDRNFFCRVNRMIIYSNFPPPLHYLSLRTLLRVALLQ